MIIGTHVLIIPTTMGISAAINSMVIAANFLTVITTTGILAITVVNIVTTSVTRTVM